MEVRHSVTKRMTDWSVVVRRWWGRLSCCGASTSTTTTGPPTIEGAFRRRANCSGALVLRCPKRGASQHQSQRAQQQLPLVAGAAMHAALVCAALAPAAARSPIVRACCSLHPHSHPRHRCRLLRCSAPAPLALLAALLLAGFQAEAGQIQAACQYYLPVPAAAAVAGAALVVAASVSLALALRQQPGSRGQYCHCRRWGSAGGQQPAHHSPDQLVPWQAGPLCCCW